jgi:hypothetical protein
MNETLSTGRVAASLAFAFVGAAALDARTLAELAAFLCGGRMPNGLRFTPDGRFVPFSTARLAP